MSAHTYITRPHDSVTYTFQGNYRLPSNGQAANIIDHTKEHSVENFENLRAVVWIQDGNKAVHQSSYAFDKSDICNIKTITANTVPTLFLLWKRSLGCHMVFAVLQPSINSIKLKAG